MNPEHARRLAARALTGLVILGAIYLVSAHTVAGQRFDDAAKLFAVTRQLPYQRLEKLAFLVLVGAIVLALGAVWWWARDHLVRAFAWLAVATIPPWLLAELAKVSLPRPHLHPAPTWIGSPAFPSGHVTMTASCMFAVVALAPPALRRRVTAFATLTILTSITFVIVSGMHRPADVYGATVLALTWVTCLTTLSDPQRRPFARATRAWLTGAAILAIVGVSIASAAFHSAAGGRQNLPAQSVINHTLWGALILGYGIVLGAGAFAYELLGPATPNRPATRSGARSSPWGRSPSSGSA